MWPPHSVNTCPTPACLSTRATSSPPVSSAIELLPLDRFAIEAARHQSLARRLDRDASAGDVGDEALLAGDRLREGVADDRTIAEAGPAPRERLEVVVVDEPARVAHPVEQRRRRREAGLVEIQKDRADRDDADLLGDEERPASVAPVEHEAAERSF